MSAAEETPGTGFNVDLLVWRDPETGYDGIFPSEREIAERRKRAEMMLKDAVGLNNSLFEPDKQRAVLLRNTAYDMQQAADRIEAMREKITPLCTTKSFRVRRPLNGVYTQAKRKAKIVAGGGQAAQVDLDVLRDEIMPKCIFYPSGSPVDVANLDTLIAEALWDRLYGALFASEERLLFLSL